MSPLREAQQTSCLCHRGAEGGGRRGGGGVREPKKKRKQGRTTTCECRSSCPHRTSSRSCTCARRAHGQPGSPQSAGAVLRATAGTNIPQRVPRSAVPRAYRHRPGIAVPEKRANGLATGHAAPAQRNQLPMAKIHTARIGHSVYALPHVMAARSVPAAHQNTPPPPPAGPRAPQVRPECI